MSLPHGYFIISEMRFLQLLDNQRKTSEIAKRRIMDLHPSKFENRNLDVEWSGMGKVLIAVEIYEYYKQAVFFPDTEVLEKIRSLHFREEILRWFISAKDLQQQYEIIRRNMIEIDTCFAFSLIRGHLIIKFSNELFIRYFGITRDEVRMTKSTKELILLKNRKSYSGSNSRRPKNMLEMLLNKVVEDLENSAPTEYFGIGKPNLDSLITISKGKTEANFIKVLVENSFQYDKDKINLTTFYGIIFDLIRLILPDHYLMDEPAYDEKELSYKSYKAYKAKAIRALISPSKPSKR